MSTQIMIEESDVFLRDKKIGLGLSGKVRATAQGAQFRQKGRADNSKGESSYPENNDKKWDCGFCGIISQVKQNIHGDQIQGVHPQQDGQKEGRAFQGIKTQDQ